MFAGVHGVDGDLGVPVVDGADEDGVDVLAVEQGAIIFVDFDLGLAPGGGAGSFEGFVGAVSTLGEEVAGGGAYGVERVLVARLAIVVPVDDVEKVGIEALPADADEADDELLVGPEHGPDDRSRRLRRLRLGHLLGHFGRTPGHHSRRAERAFLDKLPPRLFAGFRRGLSVFLHDAPGWQMVESGPKLSNIPLPIIYCNTTILSSIG